jgi:hypothetical protein
MSGTEPQKKPAIKKLAVATIAAVGVAAVVLVVAVLPAEYGLDPTGIGEALGLVILSDPAAAAAADVRPDGLVAEENLQRSDTITFDLEPSGFVEYKYRLEAGQSMLYAWQTTSPVRSEMHSEADGAQEGTAEFFEIIESTTAAQGSYTAPFPGIHGWYWLNLSEKEPISVTLTSTGFYSYAMEFGDDGSRRRYEPDALEVVPPEAIGERE